MQILLVIVLAPELIALAEVALAGGAIYVGEKISAENRNVLEKKRAEQAENKSKQDAFSPSARGGGMGDDPDDNELNKKPKEKQVKKPGLNGKEGADDIPSWAKGEAPYVGESGKDFADRLLTAKYGKGNYDKGPTTEHNIIRKWADRSFENPK